MKNFGTERGTRVSRERTLVAIPPRAVIGLEAEFNLFVNGRRRRPEKVFGDPSRLVRRRMIRRIEWLAPAAAGVLGVAILAGVSKLWRDFNNCRRDLDRPRERWENSCLPP